jgi:signal transduction histidine kinase
MFEWIRNHKWLASGSFFISTFLIFGGLDLVFQGPETLLVASLLCLSTGMVFIYWPVSILLIAASSVLIIYFELLPVYSGLAASFAILLSAGTRSQLLRRIGVAVAIVGGIAVSANTAINYQLGSSFFGLEINGNDGRFTAFLLGCLLVLSLNLLFALVGSLVITRETHVGTDFDRAISMNRQAQLALENAQQRERFQIARDINELIIQKVTAVVSQTEGGLYAAKADPSAAMRSLERVGVSAKAAHIELRRLYDMLNREQAIKAAPPRINDLEALAVTYRELGFNAAVRHDGQRFALNEGAELVIFKIAFDALENVKQHCPIGTDVTIDFSWVSDGMQVLIKDNGIEVANRDSAFFEGYNSDEDYRALVEPISGVNVTAMKERAALYDGSVEVTRVPGVGFTVSAIFPNIGKLAPGTRVD